MSATAAAALSRIALHLLAFNIVNYWARTLDNVLIGAWIGERELGLYVRAYALMLLPITEITGVLATAMLPALSRVQRDHAATRATYLKTLGLVGLVAFPAMLGLSVVAEPFVALLYGPRWAGVAPMLRILAIVGAIQAVMSPVGWLYNAQGRTDLMFRWGVLATAVVTAALAYGAWLGSGVQVAALYLVANVVLFIPAHSVAGSTVGLRFREVRSAIVGPAVAAATMAAAVAAVDHATESWLGAAPRLTLDVGTGLLVYGAACRWLKVRQARDAVDLLGQLSPRWARKLAPALVRAVAPHAGTGG